MLAEARQCTHDTRIRYIGSSIEDFDPGTGSFDLAVSSLVLHYVEDYHAVIVRIRRALVPGGRLVFSVEHPMCTALGTGLWQLSPDGAELHWPVDRYREEGERRSRWFVDGVVKYHRTVETYVNGLIDAGFLIERLEEPEPTATALNARPELALHRRRPPFLILSAIRP